MKNQESISAARRVLSSALKIEPGDKIVIFSDETTADVGSAFTIASEQLGCRAVTRHVPLKEQVSFRASDDDSLSHADNDLLSGSRVVLTCLTDDARSSRFRHILLEQSLADDRKIGHMPGVTVPILHSAIDIDYQRAERICDELALILTLGVSAEIHSSGPNNLSGVLKLDLGGIDRPSIVSSGVVPIGTWGNLPGGETFIAPMEDSATGHFIVNGSFDGFVLPPTEFVRLHFEAGKLTSFDGSDRAKSAFAERLEQWENEDSLNFSNMAELGIGVNENIKELTGRALFDEKCSETVHIAIGANHGYGGSVNSAVHQDIVTRKPSLMINGHQVIDRGKFCYDVADWRGGTVSMPTAVDPSPCFVRRSAHIKCEYGGEAGTFKVRRAVSSSRICIYTVADGKPGLMLSRLYALLPPAAFKCTLDELYEKTASDLGWDLDLTMLNLSLLLKHGIIGIQLNA